MPSPSFFGGMRGEKIDVVRGPCPGFPLSLPFLFPERTVAGRCGRREVGDDPFLSPPLVLRPYVRNVRPS